LLKDHGWTFPDPDGDGVADDEDCNPTSDLRPTIVVGTIDTRVPNRLFPNGCTSNDLIAALAAAASNQGGFVSSVTMLTNQWASAGLINGKQKGTIVDAASNTILIF
jgi:hypothetical protein